MKNLLIAIAIVLAVVLLMVWEPPGWLAGHDNGEVYQEHTEQMERLSEMGLAPDIYGYGW